MCKVESDDLGLEACPGRRVWKADLGRGKRRNSWAVERIVQIMGQKHLTELLGIELPHGGLTVSGSCWVLRRGVLQSGPLGGAQPLGEHPAGVHLAAVGTG